MIDWVSRRYGVLPSDLLNRGDSFDMMVAEIGQKWDNYQQQKHLNKQKGLGTAPPAPELTQSQMLAMINKVKGQNANKGH